MVRVTGPLAATLQSAFVAPWAQTSGELLSGPDVFPPDVIGGPDAARSSTPPSAAGAGPVQPVTLHTGLASAPSSESHPLRIFFIQSFVSARQKLYITTPYFVPDEAIRKVVADRARAGVDVRILLPDEHTDAKPIRLTSHSYFEELLAAEVKIYEYQPTMMHTKGVVVDGAWSVVGSANMDVRSKELNNENVLRHPRRGLRARDGSNVLRGPEEGAGDPPGGVAAARLVGEDERESGRALRRNSIRERGLSPRLGGQLLPSTAARSVLPGSLALPA